MRIRLTLLCIVAATSASCAPQMMIAAQYGPQTPTGDIGVTTGGGSNAQNSLDDLGLDESADTFGLVGDFKWGSPHLTVGLQQSSWDGSGTLSADFGGITASTPVQSDADLGLYRGVCTFDLMPTDVFELGIGFGVSLADLQVDVDGAGTSESLDETFPIPLLALRGGFRVWRIDLQALLSGFDASLSGDQITYFEGDVNARVAIFGRPGEANGTLVLGWHRIDFDAEYDDGGDSIDSELSFNGPYLGLQVGI